MESIELRLVLTPEDELFNFVSNIKDHLETKSPSMILRFILGKASKIPFSKFVKTKQKRNNQIKKTLQEVPT